ncbi:divergent polysaccharide deacetylase family protein [Candidatus Omnitrophota bacterium]
MKRVFVSGNLGVYKAAVIVLSTIVILQWALFFIFIRPKIRDITYAPLKGKIAIVIDDWGYSLQNIQTISQFRFRVTVSVLPNLKFSRVVAEKLHGMGHEVILHLPMEPQEPKRLEKNTILTSMDASMVRNILADDLKQLRLAQGVSNHMGSRATEDMETVTALFKELKRRKLYFLDSRVSTKSVCQKVAASQRLRFAKRDVFLDNRSDPEYILAQIEELKERAVAFGMSIGIGHDRRNTLEVLREVIPELEKEGFKMVVLSELVKKQ